jgi:raffinose/stachyose/melibiose transport system substrate-binding protein
MEINFQNAKNLKKIFDFYLNNSTTAPTLLGCKSVDDSMAEFALGFNLRWFRTSNGVYGQISGVAGIWSMQQM